jgi:hypothetical protein
MRIPSHRLVKERRPPAHCRRVDMELRSILVLLGAGLLTTLFANGAVAYVDGDHGNRARSKHRHRASRLYHVEGRNHDGRSHREFDRKRTWRTRHQKLRRSPNLRRRHVDTHRPAHRLRQRVLRHREDSHRSRPLMRLQRRGRLLREHGGDFSCRGRRHDEHRSGEGYRRRH